MWFYATIISISCVITTTFYLKKILSKDNIKMSFSVVKEVYKTIRDNGIGICYKWTNKITTNVLGKHLIEMHHKYYIVNYPFGVNWYKIIIPRKRGPCLIDEIIDGEGKDIKANIFEYMGPCHNFHGLSVTPSMLGQTQITFKYLDGTEKTFANNDIITLN